MANVNRRTVTLPGSRGQDVTVCECHADLVVGHKWYVLANGYVARSGWNPRRMYYIHRVITGAPKGKVIDHINGDPSYNVCWNLRIGSQHDNIGNSRLDRRNTSGFKGVGWHKQSQKWRAYISVDRHQKSLGLFDTIEEAAVARLTAAKDKWGDYSKG